MEFYEVLKELRTGLGLTQTQLAHKSNLATSCIAMLESNNRTPSANTLIALSGALNVSTDYLLGLEDDFGVKKIAPAPNTGNEDYSEKERELIDVYRTLDDEMQQTLWSLLNTWKPTYLPPHKKHSK